jgi:hypothetical protein
MMLNRFSKVWFNQQKELQDISNKVLVVLAVGMGFQYTFSKFSECMSLAMLENIIFCGNNFV